RVIEGQDGIFELVVEVRGVSVGIRGIFVVSNCPPGHAFVPTLDPPPIEDTQVQHAIESSLHAARSRRFEWWQRGIEPHVSSSDKLGSNADVIVRQEGGSKRLHFTHASMD